MRAREGCGRGAPSRRGAVAALAPIALVALVGAAACESALRGEDPNAIHARAAADAAVPPIVAETPPEPEEPDLPASAAANAEKVVAALRPAFRDCYEAALGRDPRMEGFTTVEVRLEPMGRVVGSTPTGTFGLDAKTAECMANVLRGAVFEPVGPVGAKLNVPLRFKPDVPAATTSDGGVARRAR